MDNNENTQQENNVSSQQNQVEDFFDAVHVGQIETVRDLLSQGFDVNTTDERGITALHYATEDDDIEMLNLLLDNEAYTEVLDESLDTPLHIAASRGYLQVVETLLDHGANINSLSGESTPLTDAILDGNNEVALKLLSRGANPNGSGLEDSGTLLHIVIGKGDSAMVETLLSYRADPNRLDYDYECSPLYYAIQESIQGRRLDTVTVVDMIDMLVSSGADPKYGPNNRRPIDIVDAAPEEIKKIMTTVERAKGNKDSIVGEIKSHNTNYDELKNSFNFLEARNIEDRFAKGLNIAKSKILGVDDLASSFSKYMLKSTNSPEAKKIKREYTLKTKKNKKPRTRL